MRDSSAPPWVGVGPTALKGVPHQAAVAQHRDLEALFLHVAPRVIGDAAQQPRQHLDLERLAQRLGGGGGGRLLDFGQAGGARHELERDQLRLTREGGQGDERDE
jgi:hypothetical protein